MKVNDRESLLHKSHISDRGKYKAYRYRYVILAVYCALSFLSALMATCMSSIITNLQDIYDLGLFIVNFGTSLIFFAFYPPMSFVANYILDEKGLRASIYFASTLLLIGLWLRVLSEKSFFFIFAGQAIGALGQPCLQNVPQKLSAVWFPPEQRPFSTTLASLANPLGAGGGLIIAHMFVDNNAYGDDGRRQVKNLMLGVAIIGTVIIIPSYFLFRDKPPTPPSKGAEARKYSYKESLRQLSRNYNYVLFIISSGIAWSSVNVLSAILQPLFTPYGFSGSQSGILGAVTLLMGLVGSVVWGIYVSKTKRYKQSLIICAIISICCLIGVNFLLETGNFYLMIAITIFYGFFTTPLLPLSFEFCAEISFPVAEGAAGGFLVFMIQIFSVGGTLGVDALLDNDTKENAMFAIVIMIGLVLTGLIGFIFIKEDLRRTRLEQGDKASPDLYSGTSEQSNPNFNYMEN